jgi:4-hydroxy-tetrahydrodipicolinate synthase
MTINHDTFAGVYPAMTTPFTDGTDEVDHEQLAADARRLADAGVDGLVPVGSTGEAATLTHDEHAEVVETVVDAVDVPVIAGTGSNSTWEALDLTERAADAGADGALLISPYYNKPEPAGQYEHFVTVADAVDIPQIVYNVPSRTGLNLDVDTVVDLAAHENVRGYKAASSDANRISELIERTRDERFDVLSGDDGMTLPVMAAGATGTISVVANVEPERTAELVHAALVDDLERAREIHQDLGPLMRALFRETNPIPVKEAMAIRGYGPAEMRSPLTRGSDETLRVLTELLAELEGAADEAATEA